MENPYQSPEEVSAPLNEISPGGLPFRPRGLVHHVRVLAILMIVQGALELIMAGTLAFFAVAMPRIIAKVEVHNTPNTPSPKEMFMMMTVMYGIFAAVVLVAAALHIVAGIQSYRFQRRVLGIVAVSCGALTLLSCYCLPTAIAVGVYGLIVYLNPQVTEAFQLRQSGYSAEQILTAYR
jgi:hypothetical protein